MNTHVRERENYADPQRTAFLEITPQMRRLLEVAVEDAMNFVESMTLFLDEADGDGELEEDDAAEDDDPAEAAGDEAEPSLGSVSAGDWHDQRQWAQGSSDDAEDEHDGREESADNEPWLGATEPLPREPRETVERFRGLPLREGPITDPLDQTRWAMSGIHDMEADDDNDEDGDPAEPAGDEAEPSLGSVSHWYQPNWACGYTGDLEADAGDEGEREDCS